MMKHFNKTLLALSITLASSHTLAAGFQLNSQSATGLGRAMAGDAVIADNASVLSRNPAAMALFDKKSLSLGITYADVDVKVDNVSSATTDFGSDNDAGTKKFIPNAYYIQPLSNKWAIGFAAFSNFGTGTDPSAITTNATSQAPLDLIGETEITSINFNTSASYRINEQLSLGLGVDFVYGNGKLTRHGPLYNPADGSILIDDLNVADVEANGWGIGAIAGLVYEFNADNRIGASFRYSPSIKASGDPIEALNTSLELIEYDKIDIPLPNIAQIAGFHQLTERFALSYTVQFTEWSEFKQITLLDAETDGSDYALKTYEWKDSWLFSVGGTYDLNDSWTLRAGYLHDKGVVDNISSISIPDSDRDWYTAGLGFHLNTHSTIDFGVAYVRGKDTALTEYSAFVGDVNANTHSNGTYYSLQYSYNF